MDIIQLELDKKDISINNNIIKYNKNNEYINYKNKICIKPWGYEYLAFESIKLGIWILNININNKTSLHTHFNKDTILIVISGCIKLNLINDNYKLLSVFDIIHIPKNKFHGIECISDEALLFELEIFSDNINFSDKNDLFRISDIYNRDNIGYEKSIQISNDLIKYNYKYFENNYKDDIFILHNNFNNFNNLNFNDSIYILLNGNLFYNGLYLKEGSILNNDIIKFLINNNNNKNFQQIEILEIHIPYYKNNRKIIYNQEHLKLLINFIDNINKKNILTSGCFDIIHIGHIEFLKKSKYLGDNLFVCLSNDKQIKKLKGENRPINNYNDRIELLKSINYIDYIILYNEEDIEKEKTLDEIMNIINPYYWVKGSDYNKEDILKKHPTINIKLFENIPNISTTIIINNILK